MTNFKIRFAKPSDKGPVISFCQKLEDDYIFKVWDKWLNDSSGKIFVVTIDDLPIAMQRVVRMSDKEAWWEGVRVDSRYQKQGILKTLEHYRDKYLKEHKIEILRCCIYSHNKIMEKIISRQNRWIKVNKYTIYYCEKSLFSPQKTKLIQLDLNDFTKAISIIKEKDIYVSIGAKWQELTSEQFKKLLMSQKIWGLKENNKLTNIVIRSVSETSLQKFWIGYVGGIKEKLPTVLEELKKLAYQESCSDLAGFLPYNQAIEKIFTSVSYQVISEEKCCIYELKIN